MVNIIYFWQRPVLDLSSSATMTSGARSTVCRPLTCVTGSATVSSLCLAQRATAQMRPTAPANATSGNTSAKSTPRFASPNHS